MYYPKNVDARKWDAYCESLEGKISYEKLEGLKWHHENLDKHYAAYCRMFNIVPETTRQEQNLVKKLETKLRQEVTTTMSYISTVHKKALAKQQATIAELQKQIEELKSSKGKANTTDASEPVEKDVKPDDKSVSSIISHKPQVNKPKVTKIDTKAEADNIDKLNKKFKGK